MKKLLALILLALVSCGETNLDKLKLDYTSKETLDNSLIDIQSALTKDQYQRLMQIIKNTTNKEIRAIMTKDKELSSTEWDKLIHNTQSKAFHNKSVREILDAKPVNVWE